MSGFTLNSLPGLAAIVRDGRGARLADITAGVITGLVLVPQAVAFSQLAGLPAQVGLAASVLPMLVYALLASSRTLSVGPVSVAALMVGEVVQRHPESALSVVALLAAESALFLLLLLALRLEVLTRVFSHPVLSGFTAAAAILIVWSQVKPLIGAELRFDQHVSRPLLSQLLAAPTLLAGLGALIFLFLFTHVVGPKLQAALARTAHPSIGLIAARLGPLLVLAASALLYHFYSRSDPSPWSVVGQVPANVVRLDLTWLSALNTSLPLTLIPSAVMISLVGYIESFAVAQSLAQKRRESISVRTEMLALGAANGIASVCGAMPVAGGFSRSMVNFAAGARTQLASVVAAGFSFTVLLLAADVFSVIPKFALAAIILVSIFPLISLSQPWRLWRTDRAEAYVWICTFAGVLVLGLELGLLAGAGLAVLIHLAGSINPHAAILGRVPGTEHFRNVNRHAVQTFEGLLLLRFDDSLTFLSAPHLREVVQQALESAGQISQVVLCGAAINQIDSSGAHALQDIAIDLSESGVGFHLAEIKGPVADYLSSVGFQKQFSGQIFLSIQAAVDQLAGKSGGTGASAPVRAQAAF